MTHTLKPLNIKYKSTEEALAELEASPIPETPIVVTPAQPAIVASTNSSLELITGNLLDAYKQCQPGTMQHVDQLMNARRTKEELRNVGFYTADGEIYFMDGNKPKLAITREAVNPVLKNIDEAYKQLTTTGNYLVSKTDFKTAIDDSNTLVIDLSGLTLKKHNDEFSYLSINTNDYATQLNPHERKFAERVYGQGNDLTANIQMLSDANISETKIWVLNPTYVTANARNNAFGRASWLDYFDSNSNFLAYGRDVSYSNRLFGRV